MHDQSLFTEGRRAERDHLSFEEMTEHLGLRLAVHQDLVAFACELIDRSDIDRHAGCISSAGPSLSRLKGHFNRTAATNRRAALGQS